ncbi:MAG: hypothetical protein QM733_05875 [Ilumatobacteraceae bacterium]
MTTTTWGTSGRSSAANAAAARVGSTTSREPSGATPWGSSAIQPHSAGCSVTAISRTSTGPQFAASWTTSDRATADVHASAPRSASRAPSPRSTVIGWWCRTAVVCSPGGGSSWRARCRTGRSSPVAPGGRQVMSP